MLIVYDSKTGNVKRFVQKLDFRCIQISDDIVINEPFILITYTTGFGQVPETTRQFLTQHSQWMKGVAASGNMNWGTRYGLAADQIAEQYNVPLVMKFELSGTKRDVETFKQEVFHFVHAATTMDHVEQRNYGEERREISVS
ncbi:class Ib ribonucleoside-diphosphate reductase assembly flavoprotein NrdI [Brevibacillus laterosporus]|uniref:class Ib ribonucleoside-diphosphate reductase assembly flavoprotein NrdI n=1 Tax=Brevibacillus laterosporus TaxID=1465 RepID=UPI003D21DCCD